MTPSLGDALATTIPLISPRALTNFSTGSYVKKKKIKAKQKLMQKKKLKTTFVELENWNDIRYGLRRFYRLDLKFGLLFSTKNLRVCSRCETRRGRGGFRNRLISNVQQRDIPNIRISQNRPFPIPIIFSGLSWSHAVLRPYRPGFRFGFPIKDGQNAVFIFPTRCYGKRSSERGGLWQANRPVCPARSRSPGDR